MEEISHFSKSKQTGGADSTDVNNRDGQHSPDLVSAVEKGFVCSFWRHVSLFVHV